MIMMIIKIIFGILISLPFIFLAGYLFEILAGEVVPTGPANGTKGSEGRKSRSKKESRGNGGKKKPFSLFRKDKDKEDKKEARGAIDE